MMGARFTYGRCVLCSIRQVNSLPRNFKLALYRSLVPIQVLAGRGRVSADDLTIRVRCPAGTGLVEIDVRHPADVRDPMLYVEMADTTSGQLEVLLMIVNDPLAPRFDVDRDWQGDLTKLGTLPRNIPAEVEAMQAGLAPGQVRRGLRLSRELIPVMERFVVGLGRDRFFIEPLAYHNAILFERYGFAYMTGRSLMERLDRAFRPGGNLFARLDGSTPFRRPGAERTVRGRSWAIYDGIADEPWSGVRMYKRVGHDAGISTFPDGKY